MAAGMEAARRSSFWKNLVDRTYGNQTCQKYRKSNKNKKVNKNNTSQQVNQKSNKN
jgi:hypothetical protein